MKIERMTASKQTPVRVNGIRIAIQSDEFQTKGHFGRNGLSKFGATTLGRGISMPQYVFRDMPKCTEIQRSMNQLNAAILPTFIRL